MARSMTQKAVVAKIAAFNRHRLDVPRPALFPDIIRLLKGILPCDNAPLPHRHHYKQFVGHAGRYTTVDSKDEYVDLVVEGEATEHRAVKAWWGQFERYLRERGGETIVWRMYPEHFTKTVHDGAVEHRIYARLFVERVLPPISFPLTLPKTVVASANELREHIMVYGRLLKEYEDEVGVLASYGHVFPGRDPTA